MTDDDPVFCAKTGQQIVEPARTAPSHVIPFPRRKPAPTLDDAEAYAESVTIPNSGTLADIDEALSDEIAAIDARARELMSEG